ncbi:tRNA threonylcarbamoyl adenosine modification protein YeaZ [Desulfonatronum thiosulfatophilum]|uniref:tRNA threonylcarbamoyl adenosine modification protein YeaZ n=1 Tax=Desulfonatronum thiosulfatophilum TaxID=617002 RepID=A0A1G6C7G1_9BACT|nr:tRNA (adenosine(37)-N6)-threonylcarbamoyltransferase complex dimerization subunit type 1 TsaB [Desulfonatronum thiosulfatophilum]SDB28807.1 tRNA threonylcarbamoyl adenosine modification protein YeaZ [Desulfonatronum thiosulfatophilum]
MKDKLLLVLNGAEERVQIVLARGGSLVLHQEWAAPARVMRFLVPALEHALSMLELRMRDVSGIACVRGPGNFTGLRLCLATTYGLAMGAGLPMAGLDYMPALAAGPGPMLHGRLAVLTHARSNQVNCQLFRVPDMTPLSQPETLALDDPSSLEPLLDSAADTAAGPLHVLGSGVRRNLAALQALLPQARFLDSSWDNPRPEVLIRQTLAVRFSFDPVEPLYLRPCDAEENLEVFAAKRGISPLEARDRLRVAMEGET